jgi:aspartyl protease family protein
MSSDQAPNALYLLLLIVLVASSLIGMRLSAGRALRMMLAWVAIFGAGFALFAFRGEFGALGSRLASEATGSSPAVVSGDTIRIRQRDDGHFWVDAKLNGRDVRFLVDSGATITTVSRDVAEAARIETGMRADIVNTANGTVTMPKGRASLLEIGSIRRTDFPVNVNPASDTNVLGMNFLSSLSSWGVQGNTLVLTP